MKISFSITEIDLTDRIIIDGYSDDFMSDEHILSDSLGNILESPSDSYWGEYNDIRQIKITWDESFLYLAVDACAWDNNVVLFIDIYNDYGIEDMSEISEWKRSFRFYNTNPDFFIGTWDTNITPVFYKVQEGGSIQLEQIYTFETYATYNTGNLTGSMEAKIPWEILFYDEEHSLQNYSSIKIFSVIAGGDDYTSGPDSAPDNLGGMANNSGQMVVLDNYVEILIDENFDGIPDMFIQPQKRRTFYKRPPFDMNPLMVENVIFEDGKTFAPLLNEEVYFELLTNRNSEFTVKIYNLNGIFINFAEFIDFEVEEDIVSSYWKWNGKKQDGTFVPFGIYILLFISDSGEVSYKETVVVIK